MLFLSANCLGTANVSEAVIYCSLPWLSTIPMKYFCVLLIFIGRLSVQLIFPLIIPSMSFKQSLYGLYTNMFTALDFGDSDTLAFSSSL